ncbi:basic proline-rich protein-like [Mesoplodon densirostris]|uniref:basic proline-rich protein-like n=1 Tax=Mesoplodon densirostris TaxID=48708 RepID=UPI0028DC10D2|nr:basic proline-rich protein-like [Mesoplodon densirostris]
MVQTRGHRQGPGILAIAATGQKGPHPWHVLEGRARDQDKRAGGEVPRPLHSPTAQEAPLCADTGCVAPVPDTRAAPHAARPQPCYTGRAQKWGALPRSPPHLPYHGFFNPLCSLERLEVPQPSPPRPRRAQVAVNGQKRVPVAYLGPQRGERRDGAAALSPPWAPRGAGADDPCPRGVSFSLALGLSGLGASRTLPFQAPPAPLRADVTAPPQPMAVGNLSRAARPPRFKSESPRPRELRRGRFGPGGQPGPGPVGPRSAPAWLRSGPDPPTSSLGPLGQGRDSPRGPSTRPS